MIRHVTGVLSARLRNQNLSSAALDSPEAVVGWHGAMQAQDFVGAKWAIGLRAAGLTDADVDRAFDSGRILRTHVLRPTWHFVSPADIRWLLALTGPRISTINRRYCRRLGLGDRTLTRARPVIERALEGGRHLTRAAISVVLRRARIVAAGQPLAHLLMDLELDAIVCSGPRTGGQLTYALLAERAPDAMTLPRDEALAALAHRYFQSHGPATLNDFSWWSGLSMKDVRAAVALADLEALPDPPGPDRRRGANYLLPNYDEYLIAYRDRGAVIDPVRARNLGVFTGLEYPHHVILDGRVAGSWRRRIDSNSVHLAIKTYERPTSAQSRALIREGRRYGRFLQRACDVSL